MEILGEKLHDCLADETAEGKQAAEDAKGATGVQIGETLDGRVITRNLAAHECRDSTSLAGLVEQAKSRRTTAATERNAESSRSHGVAIIKIGQVGSPSFADGGPLEGVLYVIDLAGSERAADSSSHDKVIIHRLIRSVPICLHK